MKAHLTKVSLALLSTVFLLGCQEQGSGAVGPEGPQFDKASEEPCLPPGRDEKGHCHGGADEPTEVPIYTVKVTGEHIFSVGGVDGLYDTNPKRTNNAITVDDPQFEMDISSLFPQLTCGEGEASDIRAIGTFGMGVGDLPNLILSFEHNGAQHWIGSPMTIHDPFPPTTGSVDVTALTGEWKVRTKGQNHQKGCTGEGGPGSITWTATVTLK